MTLEEESYRPFVRVVVRSFVCRRGVKKNDNAVKK
jgi:hypothetical protein